MKARFYSQSGFSLVEVLVVTAIMATISVGMMQMFENQYKNVRSVKTSMENDQLGMRITRYAGMPAALVRSAGRLPNGTMVAPPPSNIVFRNCVLGTVLNGCIGNTVTGFQLTDPAGTIITGTPLAPLFYSLDNVVCTPAGPTCPFRAITTFRATCPGGGSPCTQAQLIEVNYVVEQIPGIFIANTAVMKSIAGTIISSVPLIGYTNGRVNRFALWSTTSDLTAANIVQGTGAASGQIQINQDGLLAAGAEALVVNGRLRATQTMLMTSGGGGVGSACLATQQGTLRHVNGSLQVCDSASWRWASGRVDSGTTAGFGPYAGTGARIPRLPHLYACPQGGRVGRCEIAGLGPACQGQVTPHRLCCMNAAMVACTPLF